MLDIQDKYGNVVAVLLDDGTVVRKEKLTDDLQGLIREKIKQANKERA